MNSSPEPRVLTAIEQMSADFRTTSADTPGVPPQMANIAAREGFQHGTGTIIHAGQHANGDYSVQFNMEDGSGYSSTWPVWAYEIAKDALLANRSVWVASNGDPFGSNLVFVLILNW